MAAVEFTAVLIVAMGRGDYALPQTLLMAVLLPWTIYAVVVDRIDRREPDRRFRESGSIPRVMIAGAVAGLVTGVALAAIDWLDGDAPRGSGGWGHHLFSYVLGDFIGVLIVAPLLLIVRELLHQTSRDWARLSAHGAIALPVAIAVCIAPLPMQDAPIYALVLSLFPLFWSAFRFGWQSSAVALALLSVGVFALDRVLFSNWQPQQLQLLIAAVGSGALLLGVSSDALRAQREALTASVAELSSRRIQLTDAANRLTSLQEDERRRIGVELHDELGQDMTAIATRLRLVERAATDDAVKSGLASISLLVADAHTHLREVIQHLHPTALDRFGLARALSEGPMAEMLCDRGIQYTPEIEGDIDRLDDSIAMAVYRICQEAANNCVRHVGHGRFRIAIALLEGRNDAVLSLAIDDDGGEVALYKTRTGRGLKSIADRADALGAAYHFNPASGKPRHALLLRLPPMGLPEA